MTRLQLYSEQYRPEGNIDARAARRAIGRPHLRFWEVVLRESLQNSWDARLASARSIKFSVHGYFATSKQIQTLRDEVFAEEPAGLGLHDLLEGDEVPLLVITDSNTKGLQGPTRADLATSEPTHFVDFVRNIGRAEDKAIGGGTYGFGKGVLYEASACSTIIVFTRTTANGRMVSRLMGIGLGDSYNDGKLRRTGRHWWGVPDPDTGAEPLTGPNAEDLATRLGMNRVPGAETGTSIAIIGPLAGEDGVSLVEIVEKLANAATHWAWPHMIGSGEGATINFAFEAEGHEIVPPQPTHPAYRHYVGAYRRASAITQGKEVEPSYPWQDVRLRAERPKRDLGVLVFKNVPREQLATDDAPTDVPVDHVALMRDPRLVVRYLDVPKNAQGLATIGVFVADPGMDEDFAKSEPVAHDDWAPENLRTERYERNPVRQALEKIRKAFKTVPIAISPDQGDEQSSGAVRMANSLGDLLAGIAPGVDPRVIPPPAGPSGTGQPVPFAAAPSTADGADGSPSGGSSTPDAPRPRPGRRRTEPEAAVAGPPRLAMHGTQLAAVFPVRVSVPDGVSVVVSAEPRVVLDGGAAESATDRPANADIPEVLGWSVNGGPNSGGRTLSLSDVGESTAEVWVSQPPDTAVTIVVSVGPSAAR
jgi:hypothetical protein